MRGGLSPGALCLSLASGLADGSLIHDPDSRSARTGLAPGLCPAGAPQTQVSSLRLCTPGPGSADIHHPHHPPARGMQPRGPRTPWLCPSGAAQGLPIAPPTGSPQGASVQTPHEDLAPSLRVEGGACLGQEGPHSLVLASLAGPRQAD